MRATITTMYVQNCTEIQIEMMTVEIYLVATRTRPFVMIFVIKSVLFRPLLAKLHSLKRPRAIYLQR